MEHAPRTMLEMSVACLLFLMAVTSGLLLFQTGAALNSTAYVSGKSLDRNMQQSFSPQAGDGIVSGAEVVQSIARLETGEAEIVVDGVRYAPPLDREQFVPFGIRLNARYSAVAQRDASGQLLRLIFVSR
ncbi:hypothetical protein P9314_02910 [Paenibacillus validus]|uniref:hypothetical protein n=1 Tax=Paenibacillus TaxID=44249 RepID=UPI000FD9ED04|nr:MULTISPECIES: hypothetical protein [Paenibacillus]MED4599654.1 hypothetical protein [Paenibacillus validus]MED4604582.1 hypothetical protein [Paenibacillus validus]NTZ19119.1 hypothetical protein [Paenibacillus sp. JMULE4]